MTQYPDTNTRFKEVLDDCRRIFAAKLSDYGASWRMMRPTTVTDQLFIKAKRIRQLETSGTTAVGEGILPEFMAIINYGAVGIIQLNMGCSDTKDLTPDEALAEYDKVMDDTYNLMVRKNQDYAEAWRDMRVTSYTDMILTKIERVKEIEDNEGLARVSEGIDANYQDMINYAVFAVIQLAGA